MKIKKVSILGAGAVGLYIYWGLSANSDIEVSIIAEGEADFIVSFEKIEAARYANCLRKGGKIIVNSQSIDPMPVIIGNAEYPVHVLDELKDKGIFVDSIDALALAEEVGNPKSANIVLMGRLAKYFDMDYDKWIQAIKGIVKPQFVDVNIKAFELGYNYSS